MKVEQLDGSMDRRIATAMIVDKTVLGRIAPKWTKEGLLKNEWANQIGHWCVKFYRKYGTAPKKSIEGVFEAWAAEGKDKATVGSIQKLLASLSDEYKKLAKESNSDFITDLAAKHFNAVLVSRNAERAQGYIDVGEVDKALALYNSFRPVEIGVGAGIDVFRDETAIREAFEDKQEPLIQYDGDLGKFFGDALERDGFISILAAEKRGKTFCLMDMAFRAVIQRRKVAFFSVGDLSQNQMMRRLMVRAARRPIKPQTIKLPKNITFDPDMGRAVVEHKEKEYKNWLDWRDAYKACQDVMELKAKSDDVLFKLSCHPTSTLNVAGIHSILDTWERDEWTPDVVLVDYADILAPPSGVADTRDQINMTWKQLRSLSQSRHCLLLTATQADAASYKMETLDRSNFSEDKRKLAHVTGMFGLNATMEEKEMGVLRANWIVLREGEFSEGRCVHVAGCLAIGAPFMVSTFG